MISAWPYYSEEEINKVSNVMRSGLVNRWTGEITESFENDFADFFKLKNAITIANGTLSLEAAYECLELKEGDEIITTPRSFIATASAAVLKGARVIFADVDQNSGCITSKSIEPLISPKTRAITVVHLGGWPADIKEIAALAACNQIKLIEDCSQAHGAKYEGEYVGTFADIATWSFCNDKIISTGGEGGMITTKDLNYFKKIWSYRDHGKNKRLVDEINQNSKFNWLHTDFGSNMRLTELQSAIGRIQLNKLEDWIKTRTRNALIFIEYLSKVSTVRVPIPSEKVQSAWYKFYCYVKPETLKEEWSRDRIIKEINSLGYPAYSGSCSEIYLEKCFQDYGFNKEKRLKVAKELGETSIMLLVHPTITDIEIQDYANIVSKVLKLAKR